MMSRPAYHAAMIEIADAGELMRTAWNGFEAWHDPRGEWTPAEKEIIRWAFWTGARCVGDVMPHVHPEQFKKLEAELGADPLCRPPEMWGPRQ
jgi:hypothetical protein